MPLTARRSVPTVAGLLALALAAPSVRATGSEVSPLNRIVIGGWVEKDQDCAGTVFDLAQQSDHQMYDAPFGPGVHAFRIDFDERLETYRTASYDGTRLADLRRLDFSTRAGFDGLSSEDDGVLRQPPRVRLTVDEDGDGDRDNALTYFPADNGVVVDGVWQEWHLVGGQVRPDGEALTTFAAYAAAHPDATIVNDPVVDGSTQDGGGGLAFAVGCEEGPVPQTRGRYYVDRLIVSHSGGGTTLHDLGDTDYGVPQLRLGVVSPPHRWGWATVATGATTGRELTSTARFVERAGTPAGGGSLRILTGDDADRVERVRTDRYDGRRLRDLRGVDYWAYQRARPGETAPRQPALLRLNVDTDSDGTFEPGGDDDRLYFLPSLNGEVEQAVWQKWTTDEGLWTLRRGDGADRAFTLEDFVVEHPDALLINDGKGSWRAGAVALQIGGPGAHQTRGAYHLDDVHVRFSEASAVEEDGFDFDPGTPAVEAQNTTVREGTGDRVAAVFRISLEGRYHGDVTVPFHTESGTARAGEDFVSTASRVTIPAGRRSVDVEVPILGDKRRERAETLSLVLGHPTFTDGVATVMDERGHGLVYDDDTLVELSLANDVGNRVAVGLTTTPRRGDRAFVLYGRVGDGRRQVLLESRTGSYGRFSRVLRREFRPGDQLRVWAVLTTVRGTYRSATRSLTVD